MKALIVILICIALFVYAFMNRYEYKLVTSGGGYVPVLFQLDRWTGEKKVKGLRTEISKSYKNEGAWIKIYN